jgi:hypothetical protein
MKQVGNYIQPLWETIRPFDQGHVNIYNGAVEAGTTLTGLNRLRTGLNRLEQV